MIESTVGEVQMLRVPFIDFDIAQPGLADFPLGMCQHRRRSIDTHHFSRLTNGLSSSNCGSVRTRGNVQNGIAAFEVSQLDQTHCNLLEKGDPIVCARQVREAFLDLQFDFLRWFHFRSHNIDKLRNSR